MKLWSRIAGWAMNAEVMYKVHGVLAVMWLLAIVPSWYVWRTSIFWVGLISCYANFVGHWSSVQAALAQLVAGHADDKAAQAVELVRLQAVEDDRDQAEVLQRIEKAVTHDD
jgi:hypothetical protein